MINSQMDTKSVRCLINSFSRFIHLVTWCTLKSMPTQKDYRNIAGLLKVLKPVLHNVVDDKVPSDEIFCKECEELDIAINEAREFMETWSPNMSKICSVLRSKPLILKIQSFLLKICYITCRLLKSSPYTSSLAAAQHCIQESHSFKLDIISEHIDKALKSQRDGKVPEYEDVITIIKSLNLSSNQELLKESIALEKEYMKAQDNKLVGHLVQIKHIVDLVSHIRDFMVKFEGLKSINGIPIPSYFRCPLSLELMFDPVIVASGQTYERTSIQKWLDHGLTICPRTRQNLSHTNLILNYTVKALIANWCDENKIKLSSTSGCTNIVPIALQSENVSPQDLNHVENIHSSLRNSNYTSSSSIDVANGSEMQKVDGSSGFSEEEFSVFQIRETENLEHSSPEHSYIHSRSESTSSAVSNIDYIPIASTDVSKISKKHESVSELSGKMRSEFLPSPSNKGLAYSPTLPGKQHQSSNTMAEMAVSGNHSCPKPLSLPSESNDLTAGIHFEKLVKDLKSQSNELQTAAAAEVRFLTKHSMENRAIMGHCGAILPLISLLHSNVKLTQEHAVTSLLNLSINEEIKNKIAEAGALEPLIHVLRTGNSGAKENAAASLFSLSVLEEYRVKIGRSGAVKPLVDLLGSGTLRGKKDAATALFNLSIFHENKARIVQAGAVKYLVELMDSASEMVDKAVALLANLSTITEGCLAVAREGGIPFLVEVVETGSQRGKENAASILLQLCINSTKYCRLVLQEGAVPPLVALSQSGTPRAKEKAQQLLSHFRNQRKVAMGRGKS